MAVSVLSTPQRERDGRYPDTLSADERARYFHLDDDDREWITTQRRDSHRLGYALQRTTARFPFRGSGLQPLLESTPF